MSSFVIEGGQKLSGSIQPQGAKNEALQILCAVLLTDEKVEIHNVPNIHDVNRLIDILRDMGVRVETFVLCCTYQSREKSGFILCRKSLSLGNFKFL